MMASLLLVASACGSEPNVDASSGSSTTDGASTTTAADTTSSSSSTGGADGSSTTAAGPRVFEGFFRLGLFGEGQAELCGEDETWLVTEGLPDPYDYCDQGLGDYGLYMRVEGMELPPEPPTDAPRLVVLEILEGPCRAGSCDPGVEPDHCGTWSDFCYQYGFECDPFAQNCPFGDKCMPWANDGGSLWNATRCSPIDDAPGAPGDPCTVEGAPTSGIDSCDIGSMCWGVDLDTLQGTCVAMCTGSEQDPLCAEPDAQCLITFDGAISLCLPQCDPLGSSCSEGEGCYPFPSGFFCFVDASGPQGAHGDLCEDVNFCDPGTVCWPESSVPNCEGAIGCCAQLCDLDDPLGDDQCPGVLDGEQCVPWPEELPPPLPPIGVCSLP